MNWLNVDSDSSVIVRRKDQLSLEGLYMALAHAVTSAEDAVVSVGSIGVNDTGRTLSVRIHGENGPVAEISVSDLDGKLVVLTRIAAGNDSFKRELSMALVGQQTLELKYEDLEEVDGIEEVDVHTRDTLIPIGDEPDVQVCVRFDRAFAPFCARA